MILYGYSKCSTVKKAQKFLETNEIMYEFIDNVTNPLTIKELEDIHKISGLDIKKLFNTSGIKYRELNLKIVLPTLSLQEKYELLSSDGMLVKRPLLVTNKKVLVGFKEEEYYNLIRG